MYCPKCLSEFPSGNRCPFDGTALARDLPSATTDPALPPQADTPAAQGDSKTLAVTVAMLPVRAGAHEDPTTIRHNDPNVGRILGEYRVERRIGEGAMAVVYKGRHTRLGHDAAIKILRSPHREDMSARFRREAEVVSLLKSPHSVHVLDFGEDDGTQYIALEFLEGAPLDAEIAHGKLDPRRTVRILREVCLSLAEAHGLGMVHRDLKPANIFLARREGTEVVKVLDFGIAKVSARTRTASIGSVNSLEQPLTAVGAVMGTPTYMAPEQVLNAPLDARTDLYSLGVVAYHCLAGHPPFEGAPGDVMFQHTHKAAAALPPEIEPALSALVFRLLEKEPKLRPSSAEALITKLDELLAGREPASTRVIQVVKRKPRWRIRAAVVGGLTILVIAGSALLARTRVAAPTPAPTQAVRAPEGYYDVPLED